MSEWKETELGDFLTFQRGFDIVKRDMKEEGAYDVIFSSGFGGKHDEFKVKAPGVIVGRKGTLGSVFYSDSDFWPTDTTLWVKDFHGNDPKFAYYFLTTLKFKQYDCGSANPTLNRNHIHTLDINVPESPQEQANIAALLSCLDRKIENLRKQNETLEAIAQTLFKHWFVDFEFPNADGKPYKSFGGAMEPSELGRIPVGWRVGKLENICKIINGFAFKSQDYREKGIKIVRTKNFSDTGFIELNDLVYISESQLKKYKSFELQTLDFLMVMVGASIGKFVTVTSHILPALQNQNMWNFRAICQEKQTFLSYALKILIGQHAGSSTGSAREFFRKDYFYQIPIVLPDNEVSKNFSTFCIGIASKIDLNIRQIQTLTQTRDMLLPKLMSGKLRITSGDSYI